MQHLRNWPIELYRTLGQQTGYCSSPIKKQVMPHFTIEKKTPSNYWKQGITVFCTQDIQFNVSQSIISRLTLIPRGWYHKCSRACVTTAWESLLMAPSDARQVNNSIIYYSSNIRFALDLLSDSEESTMWGWSLNQMDTQRDYFDTTASSTSVMSDI